MSKCARKPAKAATLAKLRHRQSRDIDRAATVRER